MLDSPSMQTIASSLMAHPHSGPQARPTIKSPSRVLCLKIQEQPSIGFKRPNKAVSTKAVIEAFLKYSPRVQARPVSPERSLLGTESTPQWVFIDIGSTSHLFHGEEGLMRSAMSLARDLGFSVQCAASDTPAGAQAFAVAHQSNGRAADMISAPSERVADSTSASLMYICPPGEERERLKQLSLPYLLHLEGLEPWDKPSTIENLTAFFMMLGFKTIGDLSRFTSASLQERWGETGGLLWKRLNAQDRPVISPLLPTEPLEDYVHLDFPVSLVSLLLHQTQRSLDFLFARLQGRRLFAQKLTLLLHCEYSNAHHKIEIEPKSPSRNRELFTTLLENRLSEISLENPIRDFEIHVMPCPEKSQQLDFFEPRTTDFDKLQTLLSLVGQSSIKPGLYKIEPAILPEKNWRLVGDPEEIPDRTALNSETEQQDVVQIPASLRAVSPQPRYGEAIMRAPRPTRLLKTPLPLSIEELQRLKILSTHPIERMESAWWESDTELERASGGDVISQCGRRASWQKRDYYFAVSPEGQCLWVYQDLRSEEYFLHGYFD